MEKTASSFRAPADRRIARANAAAERQDWAEAAAAVSEALSGSAPLACSPFLPLLKALYVHGRVTAANEILRGLAGRIVDPFESALLSDVWSVFLHEAGDAAAAADRCRLVLEGAPEDPRLWTNLGACLAAAGRKEEAVDAAIAALAKDPNHLRADYLKCRESPHQSVDLHGQDPYSARYARLFLEMVPPFAGLSEVLDVSLQEMPGDLWICVSVQDGTGPSPFPARSGLPVIAATWNDQGFFLRSGVVNAVAPEERRLEIRGTGPAGLWVQRRSHVRISAGDFREGGLNASADGRGVSVQDISAGGISFLSMEGVVPGAEMAVTLEFFGETLSAAVCVKRCLPRGDRFLIGAEFAPDDDFMERLVEKLAGAGNG